jgi:general stress protein YciG
VAAIMKNRPGQLKEILNETTHQHDVCGPMAKENRTSKRGFGSMDRERQREIARKGGASVPRQSRTFARDPELAVEAGRKGGHKSGGNFKNNPERAAEAGRKGGQH